MQSFFKQTKNPIWKSRKMWTSVRRAMPKRTEARFVTFYSDDFIQRKFPMLTFFSTANSHSNEHAEWNEFLEFLSSSLSSHLLLLLIWLIISLSFNVSSMLLKLEILLLRKWCERFWTSVDTTKFWIESEKLLLVYVAVAVEQSQTKIEIWNFFLIEPNSSFLATSFYWVNI